MSREIVEHTSTRLRPRAASTAAKAMLLRRAEVAKLIRETLDWVKRPRPALT